MGVERQLFGIEEDGVVNANDKNTKKNSAEIEDDDWEDEEEELAQIQRFAGG